MSDSPDTCAQQTISIASAPRLAGVAASAATVTVSGLPTGLVYKSGKISGVVRAKGSKTVTIKFRNRWGWYRSFKVVLKAVSLPMTFVYDQAKQLRLNAFTHGDEAFRGWTFSRQRRRSFGDGDADASDGQDGQKDEEGNCLQGNLVDNPCPLDGS